ncbi:alpha/beta hydrolase family protein [Chitinimonas sp.]|uniref:alpha/beta hydrolase family protein n=1 Tax=Chitinimonas sp. TaxID=1934313 RepID=UPI0035AE552E
MAIVAAVITPKPELTMVKNLRHLLLSTALLTASAICPAAGYIDAKASDPDGSPLDIGIWYPSAASTAPMVTGPVSQDVAIAGPIKGDHLPLVLISHGTGGYKFSHYDTAIALANAGFVVAAVTHSGDNYQDNSRAVFITERPRHISRALDFMLTDWADRNKIDASRIGIFGFSAGGFTALVNIGGQPDLSKIEPFCQAHAEHFACTLIARKSQNKASEPPLRRGGVDLRFKAAVIAAPALGYTFAPNGLDKVRIPVQLWRAEQDEILPHPWYDQLVHDGLRGRDDYRVVENAGHFDFMAPCSAALAKLVPAICSSAIGFDRSAFHAKFNSALVEFFKAKLS